jgi:hypothetical protein
MINLEMTSRNIVIGIEKEMGANAQVGQGMDSLRMSLLNTDDTGQQPVIHSTCTLNNGTFQTVAVQKT